MEGGIQREREGEQKERNRWRDIDIYENSM